MEQKGESMSLHSNRVPLVFVTSTCVSPVASTGPRAGARPRPVGLSFLVCKMGRVTAAAAPHGGED